jgi:hypothetical protein
MRLLLILSILLFSFVSEAQSPVILKTGTLGYVTVTNEGVTANYQRGYLGSSYYISGTDSTLTININSGAPKPFITARKRNIYKNGDAIGNPAFPSMDSLQRWMNAHFEANLDTAFYGTTAGGVLGGSYPNPDLSSSVAESLSHAYITPVFDSIKRKDTVQLATDRKILVLAAATLDTAYFEFPSDPADNDMVRYKLQTTITHLIFINGTSGQSSIPNTAGSEGWFIYSASRGKWY